MNIAPVIYQRKKYWAHRFGTATFLPMSKEEMDLLGWDSCDIILVTGDAYVDHPSFGMAVIGRMLEGQGFRVGIIAQPNWQNTDDFTVLGKPNLYFGVTAGNMDSMVNRYTADRKKRSDDAYSPDGKGGARPDRATLVYSQRCKEVYKDTPVIIGGIEASLRRLAHYDYWSDKVRRSMLVDAKAELLIYGNAERALIEVSHRLGKNEPVESIRDVKGTVWMGSVKTMQSYAKEQGLSFVDQTHFVEEDKSSSQKVSFDIGTDVYKRAPAKKTVVELPTFEAVREDKKLYAHASRVFHHHTNPYSSQPIIQSHGSRSIWMNPPPIPLETKEMDWVFGLPYQRVPHPAYKGSKIPAYDMIKFSINIMRGCFGGCTFCSITEHEGRIIQNRSEASVLQEIEDIRDKVPEFTGSISDLGGPTANMYRLQCDDKKIEASCKRLSCVHPKVCEHMGTDHSHLTQLYKKARAIKGVKQVNVASGLRYDLAVKDPEYVKELVQHHVGGYLKIAPEHTEDEVLDVMLKPGIGAYDEFKQLFEKLSKEVGKEQYLIPYFIAAHPGSTEKTALQLSLWLKRNKFKLDQVQTFIPTPMALASAMYHSGINPLKKITHDSEVLYVPRNLNDRRLQKAFLRYHDTENAPMLRLALKRLGREDLIGLSNDHLVFPEKHGLWRDRGKQNSARKTKRGATVKRHWDNKKAKNLGHILEPIRKNMKLDSLFALLPSVCEHRQVGALKTLLKENYARISESEIKRLQEVVEILLSVTQDDEVLLATIILFLFRAEVLSHDEIQTRWGKVIAGLVKGTTQLDVVSELNPVQVAQQERHKESLRKMLLSLSKDIRVVFITLAYRLHLMRHLSDYDASLQLVIAQETRDVFAPLANRLGIWVLKWELEDLAFRYLENDSYKMLAKKLDRKRGERVAYVERIKQILFEELEKNNIHVEVSGRSKHIYSIWRKMQLKNLDFEALFDLRAIRVLTDTEAECYAVLGVVHHLWTPIPKEFDDYISNPKPNNYRSLHTAVRAVNNRTVEVQIRTHEMHDFAESGVAAHWRYKENSKYDEGFESKVRWLRQLLNWQQEADEEQLDQFDEALAETHIYVLSPQGEVVELPEGSTALDFAYHIHTDLGHRTQGAKADGHILPLTEPLQTMQKVEILTTKEIKPSRDWMDVNRGYLKTSSARGKVKAWFRKQSYEENVKLGGTIAKKEAKRLQVNFDLEKLAHRLKKRTEEEALAAIGSGEASVAQVVSALDVALEVEVVPVLKKAKTATKGNIEIAGVGGLLTEIASCCHPVAGDKIVGYITQGRGVAVHRNDCAEALYLEAQFPDRMIDISWVQQTQTQYVVDIRIEAYARDTLLKDLTLLCANEKVAVLGLETMMDRAGDTCEIKMAIEVRNIAHLSEVLGKIENVRNVISVIRG